MRPITWLHISDFHFRESDEQPRKAVLSAMLEDITQRCADGLVVDFVLATGDLAFSGRDAEYNLVESFFGDLSAATGLPYEKIFCVPGNHDVQRERYKTLFIGARQKLQTANDVYAFLADFDERDTLLKRQSSFSRFQKHVLARQQRKPTLAGLGYVSFLEIDDLNIAIIGLNSAWLSEGGDTDERQLVLGEHQVLGAIDIAVAASPHLIIGMQHHPFDYLKRFDQQSTERRLQEVCHFFHCGHLHEPDAVQAVTRSGNCLTLSAGASFESRTFHNSYSVVAFDPLHTRSEVTFVQYKPSDGAFSYESNRSYSHEIAPPASCPTAELATSIEDYCQDASNYSYYLTSLLLGDVADVPVRKGENIAFGSPELLSQRNDSELLEATQGALAVGRAVRLLYGCKSLDDILAAHGDGLRAYVEILRVLGMTNSGLREQMLMRNRDAVSLAGAADTRPFQYTLGLLEDLLAQGDWEGLQEMAERCCKVDDSGVAAKGRRVLALCLARYSDRDHRMRALCLYRDLTRSVHCEGGDWAALATILTDDGNHDEAKDVVKEGIRLFPGMVDGFVKVGLKIVEATGDVEFRNELRRQLVEEGRK